LAFRRTDLAGLERPSGQQQHWSVHLVQCHTFRQQSNCVFKWCEKIIH
jgi:hypothetical protein